MGQMIYKFPMKGEQNPATVQPFGQTWYPLESLRRNLDRLFGEWAPFGDNEMVPGPGRVMLPVEVMEFADTFQIKAELPGVREEDIEVKIVNGGLTIKGVKKEETEQHEPGYVATERTYGRFERFFRLPDGIALDKIAATFANGVLKVTLPKTVEAKKQERTIPVKAA
ncbi:MAG TPA: Hsp20/alpha crystallin family protein [Rhizomicrobium sp.]|nr:Hsp20/alpha crystallin family protein [Rhizomicrobium sp.]